MECEVKWALGSITMKKASGGDGIPVELFQILKYNAVKVLHSICNMPAPGRYLFIFQGKPFNITVILVCAPTTNAKDDEVERVYEDLQDLLELTPKKDVFSL